MSAPAETLRRVCNNLSDPLSLAGIGTWALVAFDQVPGLWQSDDPRLWPVASVLCLFLVGFLGREYLHSIARQRVLLALQLACAIADVSMIRSSAGPILAVIVAAQLPFLFPVRVAVAIVAVSLCAHYAAFAWQWRLADPLFTTLLFGGFQFFALLTARLAHAAERQRDELAQVNAHLLATRSLLEAGTRDGERLRLSRELHDVAGHSLTALKLNLELALRIPEPDRGARIVEARDLVDALLEDIRAVVGQLRQHDGIALAPALEALTSRLPGPRIELDLDPELRVARVGQAETILRCVQESLTNALRHADAQRIRVRVRREGELLHLEVVDDGRGRAELHAGHGLTGMRERIEDAGGRIEFETTPGHGFRVLAHLPLGSTT